MTANRGTLKAFQDGIYTALTGHARFATVAIVNCDDGDLESLLNQAVAKIAETSGKGGAYPSSPRPEVARAPRALVRRPGPAH